MPLKGARQHVARLRILAGADTVRLVEQALFAAGELIQTEAQLSITRGAVSGKGHVPSAPGEPPNQDTGVLAGNIETTRVGKLRVRVSSKAGYSAPLEFGTSKMAARPFMRPARDKKKGEARDLVVRAVQKAARQARQR